jgi:2-polyprenyl-6-methoxyphenol hydroxylase-like FAD-dependent oxidoreductase
MVQELDFTDVIVIGAGPTGLVAACEAARHGLSVRIVERNATRSTHSKALVLHARTMEVLESLGCISEILQAGKRFRALHVWTLPDRSVIRIDLLRRRWGDTRYPYWLSIPQYETERVLEAHLTSLGGRVAWNTELVALEKQAEEVLVTLKTPEGERKHRARWVLGCDGGRSKTRQLVGIKQPRTDVGVTFALADVQTKTDLVEDEGHVVLADQGLLLIVPMPEPGIWRLIAQVPDESKEMNASDWTELIRVRSGITMEVESLGWTSQFGLTSGVAEQFRNDRVFLLGDAAHVHSPVGGQGLNTGVQDAHNLGWKLALAQRPELSDLERENLLASYQIERQEIARSMVQSTSRATRALTIRNRTSRRLLRSLVRLALSSSRLQDKLGRDVGMLDLRTQGAPRLFNPQLPDGKRLHDHIDPRVPTLLRWQGEELLVRPDRIVAPIGSLPHYANVSL